MLSFKSNVKLDGLSPQIVAAMSVVYYMFSEYTKDVVVTSVNDSTHGTTSLHKYGRAMDFRTKNLFMQSIGSQRVDALNHLRDRIAMALPGYDVVLEDVNKDNEHLHVEYDPKPAASQTKV